MACFSKSALDTSAFIAGALPAIGLIVLGMALSLSTLYRRVAK